MSVQISIMVKKYAKMVGVSTGILDIFASVIQDSYHHKIRKHASMPGRVRLRMDFQVAQIKFFIVLTNKKNLNLSKDFFSLLFTTIILN